MKHSFLICTIALLLAASCKTVKKTQQIQEAITKKDTTQTVVIDRSVPSVDSGAIVKQILDRTLHNKIDFNTFNAKIKVDYEGAEKSDNYTAYVSMRKDSIILIKIKGSFLGISAVGLEAKIRKDSVVVVQLVGQKSVTLRSISYLQEVTQLPFDFYTLQDLIIGNPVFVDSNVVSYKAGPSQLLVLVVGEVFKHLLTIDNNGNKLLHSKLDDVNTQRNRTGDITFGEYKPMGGYQFSTYRKISVAEKSKLDITLDFKEYGLNEPLKYNFDIPKNLKRL